MIIDDHRCPNEFEEFDMGNALAPFDTLDDAIARLDFIRARIGTGDTCTAELIAALLILARELKKAKGGDK